MHGLLKHIQWAGLLLCSGTVDF